MEPSPRILLLKIEKLAVLILLITSQYHVVSQLAVENSLDASPVLKQTQVKTIYLSMLTSTHECPCSRLGQ